MQNVEQRVKNCFAKQFGMASENMQSENTLRDFGGDSLDQLELLMWIEEEFDLEIPDEEGLKWNTVQQCIDYVMERTK